MRKLLAALLVFIAPFLFPDPANVAVVFDLSFSMGLTDQNEGESRQMTGAAVLDELTSGISPNLASWALLTADDEIGATLQVGFGEPANDIVNTVVGIEPWGKTSLAAMIGAGADFLEGLGPNTFLLLISDCINTHGVMYDLPDIGPLKERGVTLLVLGFATPEYPELATRARDWMDSVGGAFFLPEDIIDLRRVIETGEIESEATEYKPAPPVPRPSAINNTYAFPIWWLFLLPILGLAAYLWRPGRTWLAERKKRRSAKPTEVADIGLVVTSHGGERVNHSFEEFPIKVGSTGKADLVLERPRITSGPRTFSIVVGEKGPELTAKGLFIINGVGRSSAQLSAGDTITYGRYRIEFGGITRSLLPVPPVPRPRRLSLAPVALLFVILAIVFRSPVEIEARGKAIDETPTPAVVEPPSTSQPVGSPPPDRVAIRPFPTVMWAPGVTPDYLKLDALFIHAHPDDESLDFGVLISRLTDSGRKVGVVLFTDGGSGLDQYPERKTGGDYPGYDLRGESLASVRTGEALRALSLLGVHHYIRIGLPNHAYNGGLDVLTPGSVISAWGGEAALIGKLREIISGYNPDIVVSPEGPSDAFEHFEHESVGLLVEKALAGIGDSNEVPAWLVSVDPLQKSEFPDAIGVKASGIHRQSGLAYREVQGAALSEHITQRDASVIGVENLSNFANEYYRVMNWRIDSSIEEYLTAESG